MVIPIHHAVPDSGSIVFPSLPNEVVRVLASSGDRLRGGRSVTYLLTSARTWHEPLHRAVLEVDWPDSLGAPQISLPLVRSGSSKGRTVYSIEVTDFKPDKDLVVSW